MEECKNISIPNEPHVLARVFKLFVKNEYGERMSLLCLVQRLTSEVLLARIKTSDIYNGRTHLYRIDLFSILNMSSNEFKDFGEMIDLGAKYDDIVNMMDAFKAWWRNNII